MDSCIGFGWSHGRTAAIRVYSSAFVALCVACLGWSDVAYGQLRTGQSTRALYADKLPSAERPTTAQPAAADSVRHAAGQSDRQGQVVVSSAGGTRSKRVSVRQPVQPASYQQSEPTPQEEVVLGDGEVIYDDGYDSPDSYEVLGGSHNGHGGCSSCDGYGPCDRGCDIAPTCLTICPPGCGPLMALWCRTSVRAEVPLFWRRAQAAPPLVTTAPAGTGADSAGELGVSSTDILLGGGIFDDSANAGFRLTLATWLGRDQCYGLMFRYWNAGDQDDAFSFHSNQFPILARPFRNTTVSGSPEQDTQLVAFPGDSTGSILVSTTSQVDGLDLTLKRLLYRDRFTRVDWMYGYQRVRIDEGLGIVSNTTVTGNVPGLQGARLTVSDMFETQNEFNGVSYGLMSSREFACWKMETMFRLGLGNLRRKVNIRGATTTVSGGTTDTDSQGLLARNTNAQPFQDDTFVVLPEVAINFAYRLSPGLDFNVGYNYMLLPKVAQAGQQIPDNLAVNLSDPLTGSLDPQLNFDERRYWIQSLGLGLQLRY